MEKNNFEAFKSILEVVRKADTWSMRHRQQILESAYCQVVNMDVWRVIGMTKQCLQALHENDYNYKVVKPTRAHLYQRRETAEHILFSTMTAERALQYMYDRDITLLALRSENKDDGSLKAFVKFNPKNGYFKGKNIGFNFSNKKEIPYLKNLAEELL